MNFLPYFPGRTHPQIHLPWSEHPSGNLRWHHEPEELRQGILTMDMPSEELRMNFLKQIAEIEAATKPKKVGRNDPCPCGSGKKYKKSAAGGDVYENQAANSHRRNRTGQRCYIMLYDTKTNETVYLPDAWITGETDEALANLVENEPEADFCIFPTKYEIHEYSIMDSFVDYLPPGRMKNELGAAIRGKGAFRRFKQTIRFHGIEQLWYDYKADAYRELAERWCRDNELEYE